MSASSLSQLMTSTTTNVEYNHAYILKVSLVAVLGGLLLLLFASCNSNHQHPIDRVLFETLQPEASGIHFANTLTPDAENNILEYDYFYNGGGVAAADFNNDGLTDLYFTGNQVSSKLYLNKGSLKFEDVTEKAGVATIYWATGVTVADINADGWIDLYISFAGFTEPKKRKHLLFMNKGADGNGVPMFEEKADEYGLADTSYSTQSVFFDYDRDGDLDALLANHYRSKLNPNLPTERRTKYVPESNAKLYQNNNGKFVDVSTSTGFVEDGYGLGVAVSDINMDGWPDVYIAKDFVFDDALYINNKNGTFTESIRDYLQHTSRFSMGCDVADFNNDSYPDVVTLDMLPDDNYRQKMMNIAMNNERFNMSLALGYMPQYSRNMLQLNNGPDGHGNFSFSEMGHLAGVYKTDWSWCPLFADFNNDGWKDLFISNGIPRDITNNDFITYRSEAIQKTGNYAALMKDLLNKIEEMPAVEKSNFLFKNNGNLTFTDKSNEWGFINKGFANGAVFADLDNDGDLDIVTNNINSSASVYVNRAAQQKKSNYVRIKLSGLYSVGAKVSISAGGKRQFAENYSIRGFQSSQEPIVHFGLGSDLAVDTLTVLWSDGSVYQTTDVKANQLLLIKYQKSDGVNATPRISSLFTEITITTGIDYRHEEKSFDDVDLEPLLPHKFSQQGPYLAVADVDKNGLDDFWIGGAAKFPGKLFMQQRNGKFIANDMLDTDCEDIGGTFFDANADGWPDLYVVSGGNEYDPSSARYQDRLYINDRKGHLKKNTTALPSAHHSGTCVAVADFDKDGDEDIFTGGGVVAGDYPKFHPSTLLVNDGKGKFSNVTKITAPPLLEAGLINAAVWNDIDNDGWLDLVVAGEWTPVMIFKNHKGTLQRLLSNPELDNSTGWWFSLASHDFDGDGDTDFIAGNLGLNNKFKVSAQTPLSLSAKDLDGNGATETLLAYYLNRRQYPVASRDDIISVMPSFKKRFENYSSYAEADFGQAFPDSQWQGAIHKQATMLASVYIRNDGNGRFSMKELPIIAQFSTVQSIKCKDLDGDGNADALLAGNFYAPDFMTGRYDASIGVLLKGDGKGNFIPLSSRASGLNLKGDTRSCAFMKIMNKQCLVVAINSGKLKVYRLN